MFQDGKVNVQLGSLIFKMEDSLIGKMGNSARVTFQCNQVVNLVKAVSRSGSLMKNLERVRDCFEDLFWKSKSIFIQMLSVAFKDGRSSR